MGNRMGSSRTLDRKPESLRRAWRAAVNFGRDYPIGHQQREHLLEADWGHGGFGNQNARKKAV